MVKIKDFIEYELDPLKRERIYKGILESIYCEREQLEITFNKYSVEIDFGNNQVTIYDDIMTEDEPCQMKIDAFFKSIKED